MAREKLKSTRQTCFVDEIKSVIASSAVFLKANSVSVCVVLFVIVCGLFLPNYVVLKSRKIVNNAQIADSSRRLRYWNICEGHSHSNGPLRTMNRVFDRLGYQHVNASHGDDWDVLWSFQYPFDLGHQELYAPLFSKPLKPHQRINHFVGMGGVTNKSFMTTINRDLPFILPGFHQNMEQEFNEYVKKNITKKFVEKHYANRGVKIISVENISFKKPDTMYQAFMDKPFLVDGHAFDMGICELTQF